MTLRSSHYSNRFPTTSHRTYCEAASSARLVEAEIMSPYPGIHINTGTAPPCHQSWRLGNKRFSTGKWGGAPFRRLYKVIRTPPFLPTPSSSFAYPFSHPRALEPYSRLLRTDKHVRSGRQVGGLHRQGGEHCEAPGSLMPGRRHCAPAPGCRADYSDSGTPREGRVPRPFCPQTGISTSSLCLGAHVLLWAGLP